MLTALAICPPRVNGWPFVYRSCSVSATDRARRLSSVSKVMPEVCSRIAPTSTSRWVRAFRSAAAFFLSRSLSSFFSAAARAACLSAAALFRAICSSMDAVINDRPSLLVSVLSLQQNIPILTVKFRELGISLPEVVRTWQYFCRDASKVLHCVRSWQTALRPTPKPFA